MKVELTVGPGPEMILKALRVEGQPWRGEDGLSRCVGRPAEGWLSPGCGRFRLWRGIVRELFATLNAPGLELTVRGGDQAVLEEALHAQAEDIALDLRWFPETAGDALCGPLAELKSRAGSRWLRRRLERLEHLAASPWRFRLVCDPDGLGSRFLIPALAERQCRAGEQPLFRLALAGRDKAAVFLQAEVEGPPLVVCAPADEAGELARQLPDGTAVAAAEDGAALLDALEAMVQKRLTAQAFAAFLAELSEEAVDPEDWMGEDGPAALEALRRKLQADGD